MSFELIPHIFPEDNLLLPQELRNIFRTWVVHSDEETGMIVQIKVQ